MHHEVFPVHGSPMTMSARERRVNVAGISDEIEQIYDLAARQGGRIVAGHTLVCKGAWRLPEDPGKSVEDEREVLFLVAELPGDADPGDL